KSSAIQKVSRTAFHTDAAPQYTHYTAQSSTFNTGPGYLPISSTFTSVFDDVQRFAERYIKDAFGVEFVAFVSSVGKIHIPRFPEESLTIGQSAQGTDPLGEDGEEPLSEEFRKLLSTVTREAVDQNLMWCPHAEAAKKMEERVIAAKDAHDSASPMAKTSTSASASSHPPPSRRNSARPATPERTAFSPPGDVMTLVSCPEPCPSSRRWPHSSSSTPCSHRTDASLRRLGSGWGDETGSTGRER
ncbi:unnamed protein product, partial [Tilletia caries]